MDNNKDYSKIYSKYFDDEIESHIDLLDYISLPSSYNNYAITITLNPQLNKLSIHEQLKLMKLIRFHLTKYEIYFELTKKCNFHGHGIITTVDDPITLTGRIKNTSVKIQGKRYQVFGDQILIKNLFDKQKWLEYMIKDLAHTCMIYNNVYKGKKSHKGESYFYLKDDS